MKSRNVLLNTYENENIILDSFNNNSLHHAYLLVGNEGVGKFSFAINSACFLMSGLECPQSNLLLSEDDPVYCKVDAGGYTDLKIIRPLKKGDMFERKAVDKDKSEILIEQVRDINELFYLSPAQDGYRVVIIDGIELMNINTANALLKNLEEPPKKTVFFLICNNLSRVLPTIRSRCFIIKFNQLNDNQMTELVEKYRPQFNGDINSVLKYGDGSIGKALDYIDHIELINQMEFLLSLIKSGNREDVFNFIKQVDDKKAFKIIYSVLLKKVKSESIYKKYVREINDVDVYNLDNSTLLLLMLEEIAKC